jgi:poly-gamma-glutamate synthesis protein (capsule biosynthesis protein)
VLVALACACGARDGGAVVPVGRAAGVLLPVGLAPPTAPPTAAAPARGDTSERVRGETVRILIGGDVIPHRPMLSEPARVAAALEPLRAFFASADAVVLNHEGTVGDGSEVPGPHALVAPPGWSAALLRAGARVQTFANNHACDRGSAGLRAALDAALAAEVVPVGLDGEDPWKPRVVAELGGRRVCVVAWTAFVNATGRGCASSRYLAVAPSTPAGDRRVEGAIERARAACDAVIAVFHAGTEYEGPTREVRRTARAAAKAGALAVVAHHPHVPAPVELVEGREGRMVPFFASLGNLVSNQGESWTPSLPAHGPDRRRVYANGWTRLGMVADLAVELGAKTSLRWGYHLVWTENDHLLDRSQPAPRIAVRFLDGARDGAVMAKLGRDPGGPGALFVDDCRIDAGARPRCE